ncbi:MAG TPA: hypothetical protein VEB43_10840 [Anaeromyxobacter sp.]|nr:hypothetical protein [Anaeromyxobacter sp.]
MLELRSDVVVLAGTREVRIVGSTREAESELASGFLPAVVLVGPGLQRPAAQAFAASLGAGSSRARIPVMRFTADADQVKLTLVSPPEPAESPGPEELSNILMVLDELANELSLMDRWRRKDNRWMTWPT